MILLQFGLKLLAPRGREPVIARAAVAGGDAPLGLDPALQEHALQRRIQGAFLDLQHVLGTLFDEAGDLVAMQLAMTGQALEDQHIQRARGNLVALCHS